MEVIEIQNLTKDYGHGRGIFDVSFSVTKGETLGFLGPNGAGKSTTMRHLMGFSKPQSGSAKILNMVCSDSYNRILKHVGYLPGEVALPEGLTGWQFIRMMQGLRHNKNEERLQYLLAKFKLNPEGNLKRMSIGEKRKLAVVTAFMDDPGWMNLQAVLIQSCRKFSSISFVMKKRMAKPFCCPAIFSVKLRRYATESPLSKTAD